MRRPVTAAGQIRRRLIQINFGSVRKCARASTPCNMRSLVYLLWLGVAVAAHVLVALFGVFSRWLQVFIKSGLSLLVGRRPSMPCHRCRCAPPLPPLPSPAPALS